MLDMNRWNQVANLPLPSGIGDVDTGLCAVARIVYAVTGNVSDIADCVSPTVRYYMVALNDKLPAGALRDRLGTLEIAQRVLAADASPKAEQRRAFLCADAAVRVFAVSALTAAGLHDQAAKLATLPKIVDAATATDNRATINAAWVAVTAACDVADDAGGIDYLGAARAACAAAFFAVTSAADVWAAEAVAWAVDAVRNVAMTADWEPAFTLLDALLVA